MTDVNRSAIEGGWIGICHPSTAASARFWGLLLGEKKTAPILTGGAPEKNIIVWGWVVGGGSIVERGSFLLAKKGRWRKYSIGEQIVLWKK